MIGTKREPPKNDSAFGKTILWNLLWRYATPIPTMMPPKTPIWYDMMPQELAIVPSSTPGAIVPSGRMAPLSLSMALQALCMTKKEIMAARAATSRSALAMPMATPTAKMIGRLPKIVLPALAMIVRRPPRSVPSPKMASRPYVLIVVGLVNDAPIPSRIPAIGSTATGSMKLRPTRCSTLKISSFMRPSFPAACRHKKGISKKQLQKSPSSKTGSAALR